MCRFDWLLPLLCALKPPACRARQRLRPFRDEMGTIPDSGITKSAPAQSNACTVMVMDHAKLVPCFFGRLRAGFQGSLGGVAHIRDRPRYLAKQGGPSVCGFYRGRVQPSGTRLPHNKLEAGKQRKWTWTWTWKWTWTPLMQREASTQGS